MLLLSIQCCFFYFCFHPLVVQSRPIPDGKDKQVKTKYSYDEYNMYTDPRNPFYPGHMKSSKAFKICMKIVWENFTKFWRLYRWNVTYGPPVPAYGAAVSHHGTHMAGAPVPPYGAAVPYHGTHVAGVPNPAQPYGVPQYHGAPGTGYPPPR